MVHTQVNTSFIAGKNKSFPSVSSVSILEISDERLYEAGSHPLTYKQLKKFQYN